MPEKSKRFLFLALLLGGTLLAAQLHCCVDLNSPSLDSHVCPLCSAAGTAVQTSSLIIEMATAVSSTSQPRLTEAITANQRPNPTLGLDAQFLPISQPNKLDADYLDQAAQFDAGIGYLFERGRKRQRRLQAAKDQAAVVRSLVSDNERQLVFNVGQQFVDVLLAESMLEFA